MEGNQAKKRCTARPNDHELASLLPKDPLEGSHRNGVGALGKQGELAKR